MSSMDRFPPWLWFIALGLLGLIVGSFLNVVIARLPRMLAEMAPVPGRRFDLLLPPSHCPTCRHPLRPVENVPLLSYVLLRGRCAHCGAGISLRYPMVELTAAAVALIIGWHFGMTAQALTALVFAWMLIALVVIDGEQMILPDGLTLPLLWLGLVANAFGLFAPASDAVIGAAAAYLVLWAIRGIASWLLKREAMGEGDLKLFAAVGAWVGWPLLPLAFFLACLMGAAFGLSMIAVRRHQTGAPLAFGPFLGIAGLVTLLWGDGLMDLYWNLVAVAN